MQDGGQRKRKVWARARSLCFAHESVRKLGRVRIWIDPICSSFLFPDYTGQNPFILSNVWGWNGLHTGNHKVWGKLMVGDVFHAVCIILPRDVFLWSWDMTFMSSIGWCLHANTRGFFAGLWEFVFFTAHSPLRLFKAMRYSKITNSNKLWW